MLKTTLGQGWSKTVDGSFTLIGQRQELEITNDTLSKNKKFIQKIFKLSLIFLVYIKLEI